MEKIKGGKKKKEKIKLQANSRPYHPRELAN